MLCTECKFRKKRPAGNTGYECTIVLPRGYEAHGTRYVSEIHECDLGQPALLRNMTEADFDESFRWMNSMDAKEVVQRMKDFGLKGVRDESAHFFINPDLLAEFVQSEIIAEREACAEVCATLRLEWSGLKVGATDGRYDMMEEAAEVCEGEIRERYKPTTTKG